jgi:hypothetical protein
MSRLEDSQHLCDFPKASTPLHTVKAFHRAVSVSRWDENAKMFICHIERDRAKEIRHWNQVKSRVSVRLEWKWDRENPNDEINDIFE